MFLVWFVTSNSTDKCQYCYVEHFYLGSMQKSNCCELEIQW